MAKHNVSELVSNGKAFSLSVAVLPYKYDRLIVNDGAFTVIVLLQLVIILYCNAEFATQFNDINRQFSYISFQEDFPRHISGLLILFVIHNKKITS